ncbi:hypothetical protein MNBD_GAMMA23-1275 [hydrothermal vent metagenome]|uniref:HEPN domain-containing protein n=1 Tax=hydrothermal vent metagenome TaxID=652676 RepID=A0A3B1A6F0_9ZZZZ
MTLENLFRIKQLKKELFDKNEFSGLVRAATDRLVDSQVKSLSFASRFDLAYSAAHGLALAALRVTGYRSGKRYLVFQCLIHSTDLSKTQIRIFSRCHEKRNLAEYEGHFENDEQLLSELIVNTKLLLVFIEKIEV